MSEVKRGRPPTERTPEAVAAAMTVACPQCRVEKGRRCARNGYRAVPVHVARIRAAR